MIGTRIDHYEVVAKLGEGGMGAVYRGVDVLLERDVALKFLRPELACQPELVERFRAEAVTLARLNHPNIATLYGMALHGSDLFMVMEYVPGETLEAVVRRSGRLDPFQAIRIGIDVAQALEYAHRAGVIHRDIKPANLILTPGGAIKVTDFGIARVFGAARQTRLGYVVGTLAYMAPEQIMPERFGGQEVDGRADLYALGIVLYETLTGRVPFDAMSDYSLMRAQVEEPPAPPGTLAAVPNALEVVVLRALAKAPAERFGNAGELRDALLSAEKAIGEELPRPTRLASPLPETRWAGAAIPSSVVRRDTPAPAPAAVSPAAPGSAPRARTLASWLRDSAQRGMNWKHYTSIAALGVISASLLAAYALRAPRPQTEADARPAASMAAREPQRTTAAAPVIPADIPAVPAPPVALPDTQAPGMPPVTRRPAPRPVTRAPNLPAEQPVARPPAEAPAQPNEPAAAAPSPPTRVEAVPETVPSTPVPAGPSSNAATPVFPLMFDKVKLVLAEGEKTREVDALLKLTGDRLTVVDKSRGSVLKEFSYTVIRGAVYSQSRHPRWKSGLGAAAAVGVFAAPVFFKNGTKHWFTIQTDDDFAVLQLDKNNYRVILPAFETRSRVAVERQADEK
jgi:serine/threonine-protein kinase